MQDKSLRRSPEPSPVRRSRGYSRPLSPKFGNYSFEANQAGGLQPPGSTASPDIPPSREGQETYHDTLKRTFQGGEHWSQFTIRMGDTRLFYSKSSKPRQQFEEALGYLTEIQAYGREHPDKTADIMSQCVQDDMKLVIFGSNMIEKAGLDRAETFRLIDKVFRGQDVDVQERDEHYKKQLEKYTKDKQGALEAEHHILRSRLEVVQHARALWFLTNAFVTENKPLSEELIKETHRILCMNVSHPKYETPWQEYAGLYRNLVRQPGSREMGAEVHAGSTCFTASQMVPKAMTRFMSELNQKLDDAEESGSLDPFCLAAWACAEFVQIHPFLDGNGRTCRIILNAIMMRYAGIVVTIGEHDEERTHYIDIKRRYSQDCDGEGEFAEMVLDRGTARLKALRDRLKSSLRLK